MPLKPLVFGCFALGCALTISASARAEDDASCQSSYVAGQRLYKLSHDLIGGRRELLVCAKACPDELRESCGQWLREIEREVPSIVVKAKDSKGRDVADVALVIDDAPVTGYVEGTPIELNPGAHTVRVLRPGHPAAQEKIILNAGEKLRVVDVWTEPRDTADFTVRTRRPVPTATYALLGVGAVGLVSFGVLSTWTTVEYSKTSSCAPSCAPSERDPAFGAKTIVADISLGVSVGALIGAGIFYLARPTVTERIPKPASAWVSPTFGGVAVGARF